MLVEVYLLGFAGPHRDCTAVYQLGLESAEIVHSKEEFDSFDLQVSVIDKLPSSLKWNSLKSGFAEGDTVALTEEFISQVLQMMFIRCPNSFVSLDKTESCEIF